MLATLPCSLIPPRRNETGSTSARYCILKYVDPISRQVWKRSVIRYLFWKGEPPVEVYNEVENAYGDKTMNRTSVVK